MGFALALLREHTGTVLFMSEKGEDTYYRGKKLVDFVAEVDAQTLARQIEKEWFDSSMEWCVVFTHETTDWESEIDNPMKAAESRYCIICKL